MEACPRGADPKERRWEGRIMTHVRPPSGPIDACPSARAPMRGAWNRPHRVKGAVQPNRRSSLAPVHQALDGRHAVSGFSSTPGLCAGRASNCLRVCKLDLMAPIDLPLEPWQGKPKKQGKRVDVTCNLVTSSYTNW